MKVFVTGATGFIGRHVVAELIERGHRVVALARPSSDVSGLESSGVEIALGDMTRAETLAPAVRGADAVIHLAALLKAPWRPDFSSANVAGAANVARACAAAPRPPALVVVSSLAAGGPVAAGECRDERMAEVPVSRYGRAKLAAERAAREAGVPLTIVRPPMVFGEHDRGSLPLFRAAARGLVVAPVRRRFEVSAVHGRDLARALVSAAERGERVSGAGERPGEGVYYAGGPAIEFAELGLAVARALGREARALRMPVALTWLVNAGAELVGRATGRSSLLSLDKYREATAGHWVCSRDKLRRDLGWEPEPLEDRLAQTAAWYRAAGWL